ncbi:LysR family transcriptional regulator [Actinocorallia longicatena]|uniref:LysR family transcriptional regulator n=1 Tax=Actinocorallia longicatena TaxID=111803 RepID=A0ABP6Q9L1_9ACTN
MIEIRQLRVFRAVASTGSFSGAARELGITQPAISQQIKALEKTVGTPLILRSGRQMRLTEAGEALCRHAATVLGAVNAAEEEIAALADLRTGRVRVASFPAGCSALVPRALAAMRELHPDVGTELVEADPDEVVTMLRAGECEVAVTYAYEDAPAPHWTDLVSRVLMTDPMVGLLPAGHPLASAGRPVEITELTDDPWIAGCARCRAHLVDVCRRMGFHPSVAYATDDPRGVVGLVGAGLGVSLLSELALRGLAEGGVTRVPVVPDAPRRIVAMTLPDLVKVASVNAMVDRLEEAAESLAAPPLTTV